MPLKDPIARAEYGREYRARNKGDNYRRVKEWRAANPEKWKEQNKRYNKKHLDGNVARATRWKKANPERAAELARKCRLKHKDRITANKAKYRAAKRNRTPIWIDKDHLWLIRQAYDLAGLRTKQFGFAWHVDHIIPLHGKNVSGLHAIENLQVIPAAQNLLKNNKYEIDHGN